MQPSTPFALIPLALNHSNLNLTPEGFEISRFLFLGSLLLSPLGSIGNVDGDGGGMDFSKVGEKFLSSVRSARSLGFLPSSSDRPEVYRNITVNCELIICYTSCMLFVCELLVFMHL